MKPYYEQSGVLIYLGDCREILPQLTERFDACITDPPYGIVNRFGSQSRPDGTRTLQFAWDQPGITRTVIEALQAALPLTRSAFCFCGADQFGEVLQTVRNAGYTAKPAAWIKECPPPACPGNWWPSGFEMAVYGYRTGAFFGDTNTSRSNVFSADSYRHGQPGKVDHPTQKPLGLMMTIVRSLVPDGGICLDLFAGSGTTLLAAKQFNLRAIGIEIDERYCEIAAKRLGQEVLNFDPPLGELRGCEALQAKEKELF